MTDPLWISEADVASLVDMRDAITALEAGLRLEAAGMAENMVKTHALWGGGHTLHAIGAVFPQSGYVGTKTWAHTEGGATPLLLIFDSHDGSLKAVIEAFALGQLRTGGISGVATRCLATPDADDMALIGTGKQAMTQLADVHAVRRLKRVRVYSPNSERCARFAASVRRVLGLTVETASSVEKALAGAPVVTLVTRAREPFVFPDMISRGAHINAVGAITLERMEFSPAILDRCAVVAADSVPQVRNLSREFGEYFGEDAKAWERVEPLSRVVASGKGRAKDADLTLFKAMGMGISDLSLGMEIYQRAVERSLGRPIPHPTRATPRYLANPVQEGR